MTSGPLRGPIHGPLRSKALVLYDGTRTPHRSCGIALAETFDRPTAAYQSLRRGGITGRGTCGAVVAGQLLLGEFLGDPDPTGKVTPDLRAAMLEYDARIAAELARGLSPDLVCNNLTAPHGDFTGPARHHFCTALVGQVAEIVDEVLRAHGIDHHATPVQLADGTRFDPEAVSSDRSLRP
ncbi:C-GCAxxG-C-C family protein [Nannocystis sp.]|uniref:C-GCAxxG-C-C family protein n=1 Tax=Nannocystis sp. TaxID=1962667 RepID=UPI002424BC34|nr:C-GCAxxG-C-C family protein [Nannocystis sp.]MBK7827872.1 C_GCAxxG_C_C family protein [Nannocystis sp.]MBK9752602.1 C_GCAxxG_C_C family protein [Nannocystis sp.]